MYGFIYLTTNIINGKKYIGLCTAHRADAKWYLGSGSLIKGAVKKYGRKAFTREILEECSDSESLCNAERKWIEYYNAVESDEFYNIAEGGKNPSTTQYVKDYWASMTPEERQKRNEYAKYTDRSGDKNGMFGRSHSEESRRKIGAASVDRNWHSPDRSGTKNPRCIPIEVKDKDGINRYAYIGEYLAKRGLRKAVIQRLRKNQAVDPTYRSVVAPDIEYIRELKND